MTSYKCAVKIPVLATSLLGLALAGLGIGFFAPTGEQSKLMYEGNLWCVSNFVEKEPTEYLDDGQPKQDSLLDGKETWIRRDQVDADSEEEAIAKATREEFFEKSNKEELRKALENNDQGFFTHHFNEGATAAGPCWGSGNPAQPYVGYWINDAIAAECKGEALPDQATSGATNSSTTPVDLTDGKKIRVNITSYSPCIRPYNTCDCQAGGGASTADSSGKFAMKDGRLQWVKKDGTAERFVFAQPTTDNIIPWNQRENYGVVIPGFNNDQPIKIRDHYAAGNHANQNYLDLFIPCADRSTVIPQLKGLSHAKNGSYDAVIVKLN